MDQRPCATLWASPGRDAEDLPSPDGEVVEVPLLLPQWQVHALEAAAHREGRTLAEVARRLIQDFLRRPQA
jgi:hypothetical protein